MNDERGLPALHRGLAVIEAVAARRDGLAFSEMGAAIGEALPPSTLTRLLGALVETGVLERDAAGRYRSGRRLQALGRRLAGAPDLADLAGPVVASLAGETGEAAACFRWTGDGAELVAKHEPPERFRYMAVGGVNRQTRRHGFARLLAGDAREVVSDPDDQPGLLRIAVRAAPMVAVGVTCIAAACDAARRQALLATVRAHASRLATRLEQP